MKKVTTKRSGYVILRWKKLFPLSVNVKLLMISLFVCRTTILRRKTIPFLLVSISTLKLNMWISQRRNSIFAWLHFARRLPNSLLKAIDLKKKSCVSLIAYDLSVQSSFSFPRSTVRLIACSCMDFFMDKFYGSPGIGSDKVSLLHNKAEKREGEYYPEGTKERQRGNVRGSFIFEINAFSFLQTDGAGR